MTGARAFSQPLLLRQMNGAVRLVLFTTCLGGVAAALWMFPLRAAAGPAGTLALPWWAELIACYAAGLLTIRIRSWRGVATISLAELPLGIGLFVVDPRVLLGCYAVGILAAHVTRRGPHPAKDYSNALVDALSVAVAVLVFRWIGPDPHSVLAPRSVLAVCAAMLAQGWVIGPLVMTLGTLLFQGRLRPADALTAGLSQIAATTVAVCLTLMALLFITTQPLFLLATIPPSVLLLLAQRAINDTQRDADRLGFLLHASEALHSPSPIDDRAGKLLTAITTMFGVSRAELVLVPELREPALRFTVRSDNAPAATSSELTYAEQEMLNALRVEPMVSGGGGRGVNSAMGLLLGERTASFGTAIALQGTDRPQGMLLLLDPLEGDTAPERDRAELLLAVARQISVALETGQLAGALRAMSKERDELTRRAFYDPLTQIANRSLFDETVTRALARLGSSRRPLALLVIDLDGFRGVNDVHGHAAGDQVLSAVAARLRAQIRKFDMVARLGGDEFGILLDGMRRRDDVHIVAARVVEALHAPITVNTTGVVVGGSVGVAVVDDPASAPPVEELLRRADMAMYLAKRQGKNRYVVFDTGSRETVIAAQAVPLGRPAAV